MILVFILLYGWYCWHTGKKIKEQGFAEGWSAGWTAGYEAAQKALTETNEV